MDYVFFSYVGNQEWGTLNALMSLIAYKDPKTKKAKYSISKIVLIDSYAVNESSQAIQKYLDEQQKLHQDFPKYEVHTQVKGNGEIKGNDQRDVLNNLIKDHLCKIIFNISGGQNFNAGTTVEKLFDTDNLMISTCRSQAYIFDLKNYNCEYISLASKRPVKELLESKGGLVKIEPAERNEEFFKFIEKQKINLPKGAVQSVKFRGIDCDLIWNDGSNRLVFFSSVLISDNSQMSIYREEAENLLERTRKLAADSAGKETADQLYDRFWYAICSRKIDKYHVLYESLRKTIPLEVYGKFKNGEFLSIDEKFNWSKRLTKELNEIFSEKSVINESKDNATYFQVKSDTLVVALGTDITGTLHAMLAHKETHHIKNVVLVISDDSYIRTLSKRIREYYGPLHNLNISEIVSDINASTINKRLTLIKDATNVHVNVTPGVKTQTVALVFWAKKKTIGNIEPIKMWTVNRDKISTIPESLETGINNAGDIVEQLRCSYDNVSDDNEVLNQESYHELYKFMVYCYKHNIEFNKPNNLECLKAGGYKLYNNVKGRTDKGSVYGVLKLTTPENLKFKFKYVGGDWFERLVAQAFIENSEYFKHVHVSVKIKSNEEENGDLKKKITSNIDNDSNDRHRIEMDVIFSFEHVHCLVSCKSYPINSQSKDAKSLKETAQEAFRMSKSLNRFALASVCFFNKDFSERTEYPQTEEEKSNEEQNFSRHPIAVFDWKDLCNGEILRNKIKKMLGNAQSNNKISSNSKDIK